MSLRQGFRHLAEVMAGPKRDARVCQKRTRNALHELLNKQSGIFELFGLKKDDRTA